MAEESFYLTYLLEDDREVAAKFDDINDRDGCHISLDMYKVNLGPITDEVWERMVGKFRGAIVSK
ncbi:hypothetical protein LSG31_08465 [Fodinisporobacter ferrooxydans]|uniref:Uncharacterized protein n=1 Tax=Fodinisporobacter ferrooxydans TaxID=2901836 RepID=A0ABY4CRG0_9BACL|nr:hypothetical protein LSG31_08465 [Alicyclobacillaceae bacterium MYW30-H2]